MKLVPRKTCPPVPALREARREEEKGKESSAEAENERRKESGFGPGRLCGASPAAEGVAQTRAQEANKGPGMRRGKERTSVRKADRPQCRHRPSHVLPPARQEPRLSPCQEPWRSQGSRLQEGLLSFSLLKNECPPGAEIGVGVTFPVCTLS